MKSMLKSELADLAGVSMRTFQRWMRRHNVELEGVGVTKSDRLVNPQGVKWICQQYGIDLVSILIVCLLSICTPCSAQLEIPAKLHGVPEQIIRHKWYTVSFNQNTNNPNWVAWVLTKKRTNGKYERSNDFRGDPMVSTRHRVQASDYTRSGYDRGHMCPAADNSWNATAMTECFYMTNMCPQTPSLNRSSWKKLEDTTRKWVQTEDSLWIVCGPIYEGSKGSSGSNGSIGSIGRHISVAVPTAFFKVILSKKAGREKAIGFYYTNTSDKQSLQQAACTVDRIEAITGMDFFPELPDQLETKLEKQCKLGDLSCPKKS